MEDDLSISTTDVIQTLKKESHALPRTKSTKNTGIHRDRVNELYLPQMVAKDKSILMKL